MGAELCKRRGLVCVLVALDIKNALNTLSWRRILEEAKERRLSSQLLKILDDLSDRRIVVHCQEGNVERNIYAGVPRGQSGTIIVEFGLRWAPEGSGPGQGFERDHVRG